MGINISTSQLTSAYDPCQDDALFEVLSLEIENGSEDFEDYEMSDEVAEKVHARSLALFNITTSTAK